MTFNKVNIYVCCINVVQISKILMQVRFENPEYLTIKTVFLFNVTEKVQVEKWQRLLRNCCIHLQARRRQKVHS
jgi:hypothetical protein